MTDHRTNQLYAQKLFADELREEQSVLVRALRKIAGWRGYSGRLLRECPSDLSEEATSGSAGLAPGALRPSSASARSS